MTDAIIIRLDGPDERDRACDMVRIAPKGYAVTIKAAKRSLDQNAIFHRLCGRLAASPVEWAGRRRSEGDWKFLLISAHSVATKQPGELLLGLEGERVMLRESSAAMSKERASSLIEYTIAFMAGKGVDVGD